MSTAGLTISQVSAIALFLIVPVVYDQRLSRADVCRWLKQFCFRFNVCLLNVRLM